MFNLGSVEFEVTFILNWELVYKSCNSEESPGLGIKFESFSTVGVSEEKTQYEDPKSKVWELDTFKLGSKWCHSIEETGEVAR